MKYYRGCSSLIRIFSPFQIRMPDSRVIKAIDPGSGSAALFETLFHNSEVFSCMVQPAGAGGLERARLPPGLLPLRQPAQDLLPQDGPQLLPRLLPQVTSPHLMSSCCIFLSASNLKYQDT
jgi:hypothetical protein